MPKPNKERARERLRRALDAIPALKQLQRNSPEFKKWRRDTEVAIRNTFVESSSQVKEFTDIHYVSAFGVGSTAKSEFQRIYLRGLETAEAVLRSMIDEVEEYWEEEHPEPSPSESQEVRRQIDTNEVFVIHGRDHGTRDTVARFLNVLGLKAVILQEQASQGRTIIEKFEKFAQVDFAIALFTPDDVGGSHDDDLQPRARQNAIFELGYFIGKYGRDRVCALVKGTPEIPSDYSGVVYIPFNESESWKMDLFKELKEAGFDIDANRVFG